MDLGPKLPDLTTPRLHLRHPGPDDAEQILAVFGDREAMRYWSHEPLADLEAARRYLADIDAGFAERRLLQWAVTEPTEDRLIGTVTLCRISEANRRCEVGFMLARSHWGRGIASEAVHRVIHFALDDLGMHRIEADIDPRNRASERLLSRLGFRREGHLRDRWFTYGAFSDSALYGLIRGELVAPDPHRR